MIEPMIWPSPAFAFELSLEWLDLIPKGVS
jgi:hypothetical protein